MQAQQELLGRQISFFGGIGQEEKENLGSQKKEVCRDTSVTVSLKGTALP